MLDNPVNALKNWERPKGLVIDHTSKPEYLRSDGYVFDSLNEPAGIGHFHVRLRRHSNLEWCSRKGPQRLFED